MAHIATLAVLHELMDSYNEKLHKGNRKMGEKEK